MANEKTLQREIANWYAASELLEILAAAVAGIGLILAWEQWYVVLLVSFLLLLLAVFLRMRGGSREAAAKALRKEQDKVEMHVVTERRLKTLESVGAGADVVEALKPLRGQGPMSAEELIRRLEEALGPERAQEKLEVVRRYTRTVEKPSESPQTVALEERDAARIQERAHTPLDSPGTPAAG